MREEGQPSAHTLCVTCVRNKKVKGLGLHPTLDPLMLNSVTVRGGKNDK